MVKPSNNVSIVFLERKLLDTIYITDEDLEEEEKARISSRFDKFLVLLQHTVSFVNRSRRASLAPGAGEGEGAGAGLSHENMEYFWLYLRMMFYCKRWRAKIGKKIQAAIISDNEELKNS